MGFSFKDKVVVVFGGAGGIGQATLMRFGKAGASLVVADLSQQAVEAAVKNMKDTGYAVLGLCCDITDAASCKRTVDAVVAHFGGVDVIVHSAGLTQISLCEETKLEVYRKVMEVNFFGPVICTQAALPHLVARKGMIVVLSSIAGVAPLIGRTGYCASKYALHGFFDTLRVELATQGVGVLMVCPTFTQTDFARKGLRGSGEGIDFERSTTGRALAPKEVAEAIYEGVRKRRRLVVLSPIGKLSYWIARLMPGLYDYLMLRRIGKDMAQKLKL